MDDNKALRQVKFWKEGKMNRIQNKDCSGDNLI
jgi:hypothetical protein